MKLIIPLVLVFLSFANLNAQQQITSKEMEEKSSIHFIAKGKNVFSGTAKLYVLNLSVNQRSDFYSVALIRKSQLKDVKEITLYFEKSLVSKDKNPIPFTIAINDVQIIKHPNETIDLVAIPTGKFISTSNDKEKLKEYVYLDESYISSNFKEIQPKDFEPFKEALRVKK